MQKISLLLELKITQSVLVRSNMATIDREVLNDFVNKNIDSFHGFRLLKLENTKLKDILRRKNPYLFKAKNINTASDLIRELLDAVLYASEEKFMGDFLESLAIFIVSKLWEGQKSSSHGIDLEFTKNNVRYLVSVKSGPNWSNSSSYKQQIADFHTAQRVLRQASQQGQVESVLGICYSKKEMSFRNGITHIYGQAFWHLLTDDKNFYTEIVEPIGYRAKEHNEAFSKAKDRIINLFTRDFITEFCEDGQIGWDKLVRFNSGNLK
jgi:hypothetical protein